jgi:hypothetical protein
MPGRHVKLFISNIHTMCEQNAIACMNESNVKNFVEMQKEINAFGNSYKGSTGAPNTQFGVGLAKVNRQWYRASVFKCCGDGRPLMQLIDILSFQKVKVKDMIPLPAPFRLYPLMSELCYVDGLEELMEKSPELLEEMKVVEVDEVSWDKKRKNIVLRFNVDGQ